jgi:hypothetical protein
MGFQVQLTIYLETPFVWNLQTRAPSLDHLTQARTKLEATLSNWGRDCTPARTQHQAFLMHADAQCDPGTCNLSSLQGKKEHEHGTKGQRDRHGTSTSNKGLALKTQATLVLGRGTPARTQPQAFLMHADAQCDPCTCNLFPARQEKTQARHQKSKGPPRHKHVEQRPRTQDTSNFGARQGHPCTRSTPSGPALNSQTQEVSCEAQCTSCMQMRSATRAPATCPSCKARKSTSTAPRIKGTATAQARHTRASQSRPKQLWCSVGAPARAQSKRACSQLSDSGRFL